MRPQPRGRTRHETLPREIDARLSIFAVCRPHAHAPLPRPPLSPHLRSFILLLIQRWHYPVDVTRRNEFGTSKLDEELAAERAKGLQRKVRRGKYEKRVPL